MPWWLWTIFPFLLLFFLLGLLLGLALLWFQRRRSVAENEQRRLEAEAESDRLRLRISALQDAEERAAEMESRLADAGSSAEVEGASDDVVALRAQLADAQAKARVLPELESQMVALKERASEADRLEAESAMLRRRIARANELENEIADLRLSASRTEELERNGSSLRTEVTQAFAQVDSLSMEVDTLTADLAACRAARAELDAELAALRTGGNAVAPEPAPEPVAAARVADPAPEPTATDTPAWQVGTTALGTPGAAHVDDLKVIKGIGPVMEGILNGFGIQTWDQVAAFTTNDVEKVSEAIETFPGRIERDNWVGQAQGLVAGRDGG
ncbi:MAG: hypothetical protein AAF467_13620 [Actinomycetota bacterium]